MKRKVLGVIKALYRLTYYDALRGSLAQLPHLHCMMCVSLICLIFINPFKNCPISKPQAIPDSEEWQGCYKKILVILWMFICVFVQRMPHP